jgi:hypothetical protein
MTLAIMLALPGACIQQPAHKAQGSHASLRTWHEIASVDGQTPEDDYELMLLPGPHEIEVLYETYKMNYLCRFQFEAVAGYSYDIVDHSNPEPLVLYRWKRANGLWAERLDPLAPVECVATPRKS